MEAADSSIASSKVGAISSPRRNPSSSRKSSDAFVVERGVEVVYEGVARVFASEA